MLFVVALFAVADALVAGFSALGALTFLGGIDAAFLVAVTVAFLTGATTTFFVVALIAEVAATTFLATGLLTGVVLDADAIAVFLLLVAMAIP